MNGCYHNIMTVKKSVNKSTSSKQANEHEAVTDIVKSILVDIDILQKTMISLKFLEKCSLNQLFDCPMIVKNLKSDVEFLEIIASKVSESILNNDSFRQIVCNSLVFKFKNKNLQPKMENCNLTSQKDNLDIILDNQQQYSRTGLANLWHAG